MNKIANYNNFLRQYATKGERNLWLLKKDMPAFKAVRTYPNHMGKRLVYSPHSELANLKKTFSSHYERVLNQILPRTNAVVNLVIPVGAVLNFEPYASDSDFGKLRADKAVVHSIFRTYDEEPVAYGISGYDRNFVYVNPAMTGSDPIEVKPSSFHTSGHSCASGIHFFVDLQKTKRYYL